MRAANFRTLAVTAQTVHALIEAKETDALALYMAYFEVADWQGTYVVKATTGFMAKRLGWGVQKVRKNKQVLIDMGLVGDHKDIGENRRVKAHYISVFHLVKGENLHPSKNAKGGETPRVEKSAPSTHNVSLSTHNVICEQGSRSENFELVPDSDEEVPKKKPPKYPHAEGVFQLFEVRDPSWKMNKTQRAAAEALATERGMDKVRRALEFYRENQGESYCPQILSPYDLHTKWQALLAFKRNHER